jgi:hypothetical protein
VHKSFVRRSLSSSISVCLCHIANLVSSSRSFDPSSCSNLVTYLKLTKPFLFSARFVCFSGPSNRAYPLVRSFKAFLLIGALFLVCLFVCFVCVCRWLMRVDWTLSQKLEEHEDEDIFSNISTLVKGKCVVPYPNNYLITHCIACINFDGFLLRMTSPFWPLSRT